MTSAPIAVVAGVLVAVGACGASPLAPNAPQPHRLARFETGRSCASATASCGAGRCVAHVENRCREGLKCRLEVAALCSAFTGETGEARGAGDNHIPAGGAGDIEAEVMCTANEILATQVKTIHCERP